MNLGTTDYILLFLAILLMYLTYKIDVIFQIKHDNNEKKVHYNKIIQEQVLNDSQNKIYQNNLDKINTHNIIYEKHNDHNYNTYSDYNEPLGIVSDLADIHENTIENGILKEHNILS